MESLRFKVERLKSFAGRLYEINAFVVIFKSMNLQVYETITMSLQDYEITKYDKVFKPTKSHLMHLNL